MNGTSPVETAERVEAAAQLIVSGRLGDAETLLRETLEREPGHPEAINAFASIALARRDGKRAYEILAKACTAYPHHARLVANLSVAYTMLGQHQEALACLERAVDIEPEAAEIRLSLAHSLVGIGHVERATTEIETVLRREPQNAAAWLHLGLAAMGDGDEARAEAAWRRAIEIDHKSADALQNLSVLCGRSGRLEEAARLAERAHLWAPHDLAKRIHFARSLAAIGNADAAQMHCKQVLMVAPDHLPATDLFARLTLTRGAVPAGLETLSYHVRHHPKDPEAILALANGLRFVGRVPQALTFVDQALALAPNHSHALRLRMDLLATLGRFREAWPGDGVPPADPPACVILPRGTTAVDALVFGRFITDLPHDEIRVRSMADPFVTDLVGRIPRVVIEHPDAVSDSQGLILQTLPVALGLADHAGLKPAMPFLVPQPAALERWRTAFASLPRPLVGIDWEQFVPGVTLAATMPVVARAGTVVSLAGDPKRKQLADWPKVIDAGIHIRNADDLIAAVACLDAFVGPDGVPMHVAGALGCPGVVLGACGSPWYGAAEGDHLIWYRSLILARQAVPGQWGDATAKATLAVDALIAAPAGGEAH